MTKETEISNETSPEVHKATLPEVHEPEHIRNKHNVVKATNKKGNITVEIPAIICTTDFKPTSYMQQFYYCWIESIQDNTDVSPQDICQAIGASRNLYYEWRKNPLFEKWLNEVLDRWYTETGLQRLYRSSFRRANQQSAQDTKLLLERFDKLYKPTTAQEHSLAGIRPPDEDVEAAIAASKAREPVESTDITVVQQDDKQGIA